MRTKYFILLILLLNTIQSFGTLLINHNWRIKSLSNTFCIGKPEEETPYIISSHYYNRPRTENTTNNLFSIFNKTNTKFETPDEFYLNLMECIMISHISDSFCDNIYAKKLLHAFYKYANAKEFCEAIQSDNSLYFTRLSYFNIGEYDNDQIALNTLEKLKNASIIERSFLFRSLRNIYSDCTEPVKENIISEVICQWKTSPFVTDSFSLLLPYLEIRKDTNGQYDGVVNKFGIKLYTDKTNPPMPSYFYFIRLCSDLGIQTIDPSFKSNSNYKHYFDIKNERDETTGQLVNTWYNNAYLDLIKENQILDADFIFYWFRNSKNEIMIDLARKHIQNPEFKDARYKTVYYLVNHDFDYSFQILTKMVEDGSLHINEKKNFYRGLARLNKVPHSVLTKEQQQKANEYLKHQMYSEEDLSMKLYIDFLLSICVDEYGLSDERVAFLTGLKEGNSLSQGDIAQIDRRLKIIKNSIYMHSPSIFDSYVNGLKTEKPFIDVSKVDIYSLPIYEAKANGETWYYHDVNSEAYIAYNTNKYISSNLVIPNTLENYPVVGLVNGAFANSNQCVTNIIIPNTVKIIMPGAFSYNTNLLSVAIPNSVTNIRPSAFSGSTNMRTVYLEEESLLKEENFKYPKFGVHEKGLHPNCKIIRTKFENGLPVIPKEEQPNNN